MSKPDLRRPESIRDFWQGAGGSVSHQQLEVQGFQVLKWPSYSLGAAADKDIMVQEDLCTPLLDLCWHAVSSSAACFSSCAAVTHFLKYIWITKLCEEMNSATSNTRTWVCFCIVNLSRESNQNEVSHAFFSVSRHGNITPCKWSIARARLRNKSVNADHTR